MSETRGLGWDFIHRVCWPRQRKGKRQCPFLRFISVNGGLVEVCSKDTDVGRERVEFVIKSLKKSPGIVGIIPLSANCGGRAGEFAHLPSD